MKKGLIFAFIILIVVSMTKSDSIIIPDNAIRFRVVANSNSDLDQKVKLEVKDKVEQKLYTSLKDINNSDDAKEKINNEINNINETVGNILLSNNIDYDYNVNFGLNYFPKKEFKGVIYEEGKYDSLVITLGNGEGNNWWCVLFPPLCLLEAKENDTDEVEYQFFVKKLIDKYLK